MSQLLKVFEFTATQAKLLSSSQSVAEEPIVIDGVTVIPISKLSCGFSGGGADLSAKKSPEGIAAGAGMKIKKTPLAFLAVHEGNVQLLHISEEDAKGKGLVASLKPMVSQFMEKAKEKKAEKKGEKKGAAV